jgi:hypothetical protein
VWFLKSRTDICLAISFSVARDATLCYAPSGSVKR